MALSGSTTGQVARVFQASSPTRSKITETMKRWKLEDDGGTRKQKREGEEAAILR